MFPFFCVFRILKLDICFHAALFEIGFRFRKRYLHGIILFLGRRSSWIKYIARGLENHVEVANKGSKAFLDLALQSGNDFPFGVPLLFLVAPLSGSQLLLQTLDR